MWDTWGKSKAVTTRGQVREIAGVGTTCGGQERKDLETKMIDWKERIDKRERIEINRFRNVYLSEHKRKCTFSLCLELFHHSFLWCKTRVPNPRSVGQNRSVEHLFLGRNEKCA